MYKKAKPMPGQLENCEICSKRFTVTAYSKTGPEGGLVCSPCGKELVADEKVTAKKTTRAAPKTRRKAESNKLDGLTSSGCKTLQQLCIEKVADHHQDIDEFGDLPNMIIDRLAEIFAKRRVLTPRTLPLFLRPELNVVAIHDAACESPETCPYEAYLTHTDLEADDYKLIFAIAPNITKLILRNACQFKDEVMSYILEKALNITHFHVYAANLVTDVMWCTFFQEYGYKLESLKLEWLDSTFDDKVVAKLVQHCPNLQRLKLKYCRRITSASLPIIGSLKHLKHLSLKVSHPTEAAELIPLISSLGANLETLSLENCTDSDDTIIDEVRNKCSKLRKFRLTNIDFVTDAALTSLFDKSGESSSVLPSLGYIDMSSARDVDNNNPDGPQDAPIGLGANSFTALMAHSGLTLKRLEIASCRHISHAAFCDAFNGDNTYPLLEEINLSFCSSVDTAVVGGIFKCCPNLKKLCAFGCFKIEDVTVPRNVSLIGVPRAQESLEQYGDARNDLGTMGSFVEVDVAA